MANFREIVTKAVIGKGKKSFVTENSVEVSNNPTTILGCWVINHNFQGEKKNDLIEIKGSYDVNIWYSYDHDTKTDVVRETNTYHESIHLRQRDDVSDNEEIIVRSLKQPNCIKIEIAGNKINYTIEKELGIELVGDVKVKIEANEEEDPWEEIVEEVEPQDEKVQEEQIDKEVKEDFIDESIM